MDRERFKELCFLYLLNQIEEEDYKEFNSAITNNADEYEPIFLKMKKMFIHLPLASEMIDPSPAVKQKLMRQVSGKNYESKISFLDKVAEFIGLKNPAFAVALSTFLIVLATVLSIYLINLNSEVQNQQKQIVELKDKLEKKEELLAILSSRRIEIVLMDGLQVNPAGYGKIIWDPSQKNAILQISNLPAITGKKDYQLWLIKDNVPISAGIFKVDKPEENFYKIDNLAEVDKNIINAFAVTLEPAGGVPQPTGEMYLLGKISQ